LDVLRTKRRVPGEAGSREGERERATESKVCKSWAGKGKKKAPKTAKPDWITKKSRRQKMEKKTRYRETNKMVTEKRVKGVGEWVRRLNPRGRIVRQKQKNMNVRGQRE